MIWEFLIESHIIVLTTHVRADGDGIASELALYMILKSLGKEVYMVNQDKTPDMYSWLPETEMIITLDEKANFSLSRIDLTLLLDCSNRNRIGRVYDIVKDSKRIISLDHHEAIDCFKDYCYIDTSASSIGELIYDLVPDIESYLNKEIATCLYVSIMTDTGSFAFSNTTARVFQIVSRLMDYDVEPDCTFKKIYNRKRINHFRLLSIALEQMKTDETGKVVYVLLPMSVYRETGAIEEDNEGILEVIRGLRNLELIILLRQIDDQRIKCSLRSIGSINCNHLARMFNGGGHFKASGFVINGDIKEIGDEIVKKILNEVRVLGWI